MNAPLTEQDFEDLYTWILKSRREEWKVRNPGLVEFKKVQSAKRLLKQKLSRRYKGVIGEGCQFYRCGLRDALQEIDACFQIDDGDDKE